jgi:hypothetical protein
MQQLSRQAQITIRAMKHASAWNRANGFDVIAAAILAREVLEDANYHGIARLVNEKLLADFPEAFETSPTKP